MNYNYPFLKITLFFFLFFLSITILSTNLVAQVQLKDTTITWQHHEFDLKPDGSMDTYSTNDSDIEEVVFANAKVIENELIKLVLVPEYGGRVLSFIYKPTGNEYLYQSECGSPYGIGDGNFYYDWLMVYGGIFPTFPESEHGKTWFLPWDYSVVKNTSDTVTIRMEFTDNTAYSGTPWNFNNGITNLTCQVDVSVYSNTSIWDFDVKIINDQGGTVTYEYWTCTTLAPGSEVGDTGTPLNSEIIIPVDYYFAGWSPGGWIGNNNSTYNMSDISYLDDWNNMGIAYAEDFDDVYWGVINHENEEGVFRVSENLETKGVKLWTWGKNNIDNNMYDFSNGGADNYIELWAGVSEAFFTDAFIGGNSQKDWKESYCPTVNLSSICNMNDLAAVNLIWEENESLFSYELNTFHDGREYTVMVSVEGNTTSEVITEHTIAFEKLGHIESYLLDGINLPTGDYTIYFDLIDEMDNLALSCSKDISIGDATSQDDLVFNENKLSVKSLGNKIVKAEMLQASNYQLQVFALNGQLLSSRKFDDASINIQFPSSGLFLISVQDNNGVYTQKIFVD